MPEQQISVTDNRGLHRYEVLVDGTPAGFAAYRLDAGRVVFFHTEVDPGYEGHGVGGALARAALDDVRRQGLRATPLCPFIARYIREHPEYLDLVDDAHRREVSG